MEQKRLVPNLRVTAVGKAKGVKLIRGKEPVRKLATCAIEYDQGVLYYDRMGRVVRQLNKTQRGWLPEANISGAQSHIMNPVTGATFALSASAAALSLSTERQPIGIEDEEVTGLADEVEVAFGLLIDELEIPSVQRIGYRESFYFAMESIEESKTWLAGLGLVTPNDALARTFGTPYAMTCALVFASEECRYRVELKGTEQQASVPVGGGELSFMHSRAVHLNRKDLLKSLAQNRQRQLNPAYAAVVDIDAFLWDETPSDFDIRGFVKRHAADNLNMFRKCLETGGEV